jgi:hypothetical protein
LKPASPLGPAEPSAVTQVRKALSWRWKLPPDFLVSYHLSCQTPSISSPMV